MKRAKLPQRIVTLTAPTSRLTVIGSLTTEEEWMQSDLPFVVVALHRKGGTDKTTRLDYGRQSSWEVCRKKVDEVVARAVARGWQLKRSKRSRMRGAFTEIPEPR